MRILPVAEVRGSGPLGSHSATKSAHRLSFVSLSTHACVLMGQGSLSALWKLPTLPAVVACTIGPWCTHRGATPPISPTFILRQVRLGVLDLSPEGATWPDWKYVVYITLVRLLLISSPN